MRSLLRRLALDRPELRAWALYDWANSAFVTIIITAVFPIYYQRVAAAGLPPEQATTRFTIATTVALTIVALLAPFLGALADRLPLKKRFLAAFLALGAGSTAAMWAIGEGDWLLALVLFILGNIGVTGSFVFYDSLLPHVARPDEVDRVSTSGYALGYVGGGLLLALALAAILAPGAFGLPDTGVATRLAFVAVAVWWVVFAIPLFRRVPEPAVRLAPSRRGLVTDAFGGLGEAVRELRRYRQALVFLVAFLIYNDGIGTIIRLATVYGAELGLPQDAMITAVLLVQFVGIPCTFLFGHIASRVGTKPALFGALAVYGVISVLAYFMRTAAHFYALALLVGLVQGGAQALSRSLFASMIPRARSAELFGLFAVFEKFAGIFGPALFALMLVATGSSRAAILGVIAFFVVGGAILSRVRVDEGRALAAEEDARVEAAAAARGKRGA